MCEVNNVRETRFRKFWSIDHTFFNFSQGRVFIFSASKSIIAGCETYGSSKLLLLSMCNGRTLKMDEDIRERDEFAQRMLSKKEQEKSVSKSYEIPSASGRLEVISTDRMR